MILTALNRYRSSQDHDQHFGYALKRNLGFSLVLDRDGSGCLVEELYSTDDTGRARAPEALVPDLKRSNNPPPMLGCDTAAFVIGRPKPAKDPDVQAREQAVAQRKQAAFRALLRDYAQATGDPDVAVFQAWVDRGMPGLTAALEGLSKYATKRLDLDLIAVRVDGSPDPVHLKPQARAYWSSRAQGLKASGEGLCLSCGRYGPVVETLPQALTGSRIPATSTSDVALVSANFPAASRGASGTGLRTAPICADCASGGVNAFNALTASRSHCWHLGDRSAAIWWADSDQIDGAVESLDQPEPSRIRDLLDSVLLGKPASRTVPGQFYLITYSGNVARLVIRRFAQFPLATIAGNISTWFGDVTTPDPDRPFRSISAIARSAGPLEPGDQGAAAPEGSFEALLLCALADDPPPRGLLLPAITRARAEAALLNEGGLPGWRVRQRAMDRLALLRVVLNRTVYQEGEHLMPGLDETRKAPAYLSGRLFAIRESLQRSALGEVNASIVDRYFARAAAFPASVEHALTVLEKQHLRTLQRKGERGASLRLGERVQALHSDIGVAPGRLGVDEQAEWIAGYYQQREADIQAAIAGSKAKKAREGATQTRDEEI